MKLTTDLNEAAQKYANRLASTGLFKHDPNNKVHGENLGLQCAPGKSDGELVKKVVDLW